MQSTTVRTKREALWMEKYKALMNYIKEHHQLPDKRKVENRDLMNWWKYNKKCIKAGKHDAVKIKLLKKLNDMRLVKDDEASMLFTLPK